MIPSLEEEEEEEKEEEEKKKIPLCVKAKVRDPFGAAALLLLQLQAQPTQAGQGFHLTLLRLFFFGIWLITVAKIKTGRSVFHD